MVARHETDEYTVFASRLIDLEERTKLAERPTRAPRPTPSWRPTSNTLNPDPTDKQAALEEPFAEAISSQARQEDGETEQPAAAAEDVRLWPILKQTLIAMALLFVVVGLAAYFFKDPLTGAATWMVERFGLWGLVAVVPLSDVLSLPVPPEVALFIAMATRQPVALTIALLGVTSVLCGTISFKLGPLLTRIDFIGRRIEKWRERGEALFRHWGVWTVAIGAVSPVPYAMTCWFAGIYKMKYSRFLLATMFRIPRFVTYYYLFELGWVGAPV